MEYFWMGFFGFAGGFVVSVILVTVFLAGAVLADHFMQITRRIINKREKERIKKQMEQMGSHTHSSNGTHDHRSI